MWTYTLYSGEHRFFVGQAAGPFPVGGEMLCGITLVHFLAFIKTIAGLIVREGIKRGYL